MLLLDAVDHVGHQIFGDKWTGEELLARANITPPAGPQRRRTSGGRYGPSRDVWSVETQTKIAECRSANEAQQLWERERENVLAQHEAEQSARGRFVEAVTHLRRLLADGAGKAFIFDPAHGREYELRPSFWLSHGTVDVFELQDQLTRWQRPNIATAHISIGGYEGRTVRGHVILEIGIFDRSASHEGHAQTRAPSDKDFNEFQVWAEKLHNERGYGPSRAEAKTWADSKSLARDWSRNAIGRLSPHLRQPRGAPKTRKK